MSGFVFSAYQRLIGVICSKSSRVVESAPLRSQPMIFVIPEASIIFVTATPAAPRPSISTVRSSIGLPTIFSALNSAAIVTTAVPC